MTVVRCIRSIPLVVPFIYVGDKSVSVRDGGKLCDVSPTILHLMGIDKPSEMTGSSLLID